MLISIKTKGSARLWRIPIPFHFAVNLFLRKGLILSIARMSSRDQDVERRENQETHENDDARTNPENKRVKDQSLLVLEKWLDSADLGQLRQSLHNLKDYRGLALVDIITSDGDVIKIVL